MGETTIEGVQKMLLGRRKEYFASEWFLRNENLTKLEVQVNIENQIPDEKSAVCEWCEKKITVPNSPGPWVCGECVLQREKDAEIRKQESENV